MFVVPTENFPVVFGSLNTGKTAGRIKLILANSKSPVVLKMLIIGLRGFVELLNVDNIAKDQSK